MPSPSWSKLPTGAYDKMMEIADLKNEEDAKSLLPTGSHARMMKIAARNNKKANNIKRGAITKKSKKQNGGSIHKKKTRKNKMHKRKSRKTRRHRSNHRK